MTGTINDYAVIVNNVLKHIAPKVSPTVKSEYMDWMFKVDNNERIYTDTGVTGLGMAEIIVDGGVGSSDAPIQGFTKNYVQMHFTKKVRLTFQSNFFLFESAAAKIKASVKSKVIDVKMQLNTLRTTCLNLYWLKDLILRSFGFLSMLLVTLFLSPPLVQML